MVQACVVWPPITTIGDGSGAVVVAAVFDVDGTLIDKVAAIHFTLWLAMKSSWPRFALLLLVFPLFIAALLLADKASRVYSNRMLTFVQFAGLRAPQTALLCAQYMRAHLASRVLTAAVRRLRWHVARGHTVFLVSAGPLPFVQALARALGGVHAVCATPLQAVAGRAGAPAVLTGRVDGPCGIVGEHKVAAVHALAACAEGGALDLSAASYAYGDHHSDIPILRLARHAVAVNAGGALREAAERSGWELMAAAREGWPAPGSELEAGAPPGAAAASKE